MDNDLESIYSALYILEKTAKLLAKSDRLQLAPVIIRSTSDIKRAVKNLELKIKEETKHD